MNCYFLLLFFLSMGITLRAQKGDSIVFRYDTLSHHIHKIKTAKFRKLPAFLVPVSAKRAFRNCSGKRLCWVTKSELFFQKGCVRRSWFPKWHCKFCGCWQSPKYNLLFFETGGRGYAFHLIIQYKEKNEIVHFRMGDPAVKAYLNGEVDEFQDCRQVIW